MRKYFLTAMMFFLTSSLSAQYFLYGYVQVPEDNIQEFIENEEEYFSQAAKIAIENEVIEGWGILSRYQGLDSEPNFYWYVGVGDIDKLDNFNKIVACGIKESYVTSIQDLGYSYSIKNF